MAPIHEAQAASAADIQAQMSTQTRRMEILYRSLQVRLSRAGAEGKNTESMRSALEQELTRHAESMTLLQQQLLVARGPGARLPLATGTGGRLRQAGLPAPARRP
jgi:hypothetical protein